METIPNQEVWDEFNESLSDHFVQYWWDTAALTSLFHGTYDECKDFLRKSISDGTLSGELPDIINRESGRATSWVL